MSNSNEELKVGEFISMRFRRYADRDDWIYGQLSHKGSQYMTISGVITCEISDTAAWQRGIHPSLIPEGFQLINETDYRNTYSENHDLKEELEAARKEIELFSQVIVNYSQIYEIGSIECLFCEAVLSTFPYKQELPHKVGCLVPRAAFHLAPKPEDG